MACRSEQRYKSASAILGRRAGASCGDDDEALRRREGRGLTLNQDPCLGRCAMGILYSGWVAVDMACVRAVCLWEISRS